MTREEQAIEYIKKYRELDEKLYNTAPKGTVSSIATKKCLEFWDMAIKALEQEPCDDAISRQAALNSLIDNTHLDGYDLAEALDAIENKEKLSPVTLQQKGHWEHGKEISREYRGQTLVNINYIDWHCSNCHCVVEQSIKPKWNYCPNCGARMERDNNE